MVMPAMEWIWSFDEMLRRWVVTVWMEMFSSSAISLFDIPFAMQTIPLAQDILLRILGCFFNIIVFIFLSVLAYMFEGFDSWDEQTVLYRTMGIQVPCAADDVEKD